MEINYLTIILNGWVHHKGFLSDHFYREYKSAEENRISYLEFFENLLKINQSFLDDIKRQYHARVTEVNQIKELWVREGKPLEDLDLEEQMPKMENYSVNLFHFTRSAFNGQLWSADIIYIYDAIKEAHEKTETERKKKYLEDERGFRVTMFEAELKDYLKSNPVGYEKNFIKEKLIDQNKLIKALENEISEGKGMSDFNIDLYRRKLTSAEIYLELILERQKKLLNPPPPQNETNSENKTESLLKNIWLAEAKISVKDFLQSGIDKGIWNKDYSIIAKKAGLYGTGKTLLGSLSIALRGFAIGQNTDYKEVGKAFCGAFKIEIDAETKQPYKAFSNGNPKYTKCLAQAFGIR